MKHPLRLLQAFTLFSAGLYGLLVLMGNLMDYDSNYQFVKHVLSMDTDVYKSQARALPRSS